MFGKMLSYEISSRLRADLREMGTAIAILAVTVGVVASGVPGLSGTMTMFGYLMCVAIPVGAAISGMSDYWKTLYGQQGYFTMTLPVSGAVIYWAKVSHHPRRLHCWPTFAICDFFDSGTCGFVYYLDRFVYCADSSGLCGHEYCGRRALQPHGLRCGGYRIGPALHR